MTVHSAKGLEFPYVFLVGLEEDLFPSQMALHSREDLEEERRLFYVGLTRAQKKAFLSYSDSRYKFGQLIHSEPSRFLEELDSRYIEEEGGSEKGTPYEGPGKGHSKDHGKEPANGNGQKGDPGSGKKNLKRVRKGEPTPGGGTQQEELEEGTEVEHSRFGKGKVVKLEGAPPDTKATVYFPQVGNKQLLLKFARLKVLDRR
jgi:DNA helicase-2/ATP-dependent DNA helicase PcrA